MDVNGLDAFGLDPALGAAIEELAVENVKRLVRPPSGGADAIDWLSDRAQSPYLIGEFTETKTVWHPIGS
jgi:hypothetical protein